MKKAILLLLFLIPAGCGGNGGVVKKFDPAHVVHVSELQKLGDLAEFRNYAGYLDKGDTFPLKLDIDFDLGSVRQNSVDIVMNRKVYFMIEMPENPTREDLEILNNLESALISMSDAERMKFFERYMLYLSSDAWRWAPLYDGKALKEVMGLKGGSFALGFGMDPKEGLKSVLTIKTVKQDK